MLAIFAVVLFMVALDFVRGGSPTDSGKTPVAAQVGPNSTRSERLSRAQHSPSPTMSPTVTPTTPSASPRPSPSITYPMVGPATFRISNGQGGILGKSGTLLRFRVAVENGIANVDPVAFGQTAASILGSSQGWTVGGDWRFQWVGPNDNFDFTIYLATPATRDRLCGEGVDGYTSCRNGDNVVLNVARWVKGVPNYGAPLQTYRAYLVNHEVGHRLDHGHELCPSSGAPAPVMQQQTLGLHGCTANPWPYLNGRRYAGESGAYDDPIPPPN